MRTRWITIGELRIGTFIRWGNWGVPTGMVMAWRGRTHPFQPREFLDWEDVLWAACRRVRAAGLRAVAVACECPRRLVSPGGFCTDGQWDITVRVQVRRDESANIFRACVRPKRIRDSHRIL